MAARIVQPVERQELKGRGGLPEDSVESHAAVAFLQHGDRRAHVGEAAEQHERIWRRNSR